MRLREDAGRFVVAHPSDRALIENIDNCAEIRLDPAGPYRFRRFGFPRGLTGAPASDGWSVPPAIWQA